MEKIYTLVSLEISRLSAKPESSISVPNSNSKNKPKAFSTTYEGANVTHVETNIMLSNFTRTILFTTGFGISEKTDGVLLEIFVVVFLSEYCSNGALKEIKCIAHVDIPAYQL